MKPSFILRSLQAVRGALQLTVSVHKQKTQMNKLTAFCQQVRGIWKSEKAERARAREKDREKRRKKICFPHFISTYSDLQKKGTAKPDSVR